MADPKQDRQERLAAAARALSGRHLQIAKGTPPGLYELSSHRGSTITLHDNRPLGEQRGALDLQALIRRHHDANIHRIHKAPHPLAQEAMDALEQLRCEMLGAQHAEGVSRNLSSYIANQYENDQGRLRLPDAVYFMMRAKMRGETANLESETGWAEKLSAAEIEQLVNDLKNNLGDQAAYADTAMALLKEIQPEFFETPDTDNSAEDEAPDFESQEDGQDQEQEDQDGDDQTEQQGPTDQSDDENENAAHEELDQSPAGEKDQDNGSDMKPEESGQAVPLRLHNTDIGTERAEYRVYTTAYDETVNARDLADREELLRLREFLDQQLTNFKSSTSRLANKLQRKLMATSRMEWEYDQEEGMLDNTRLTRLITNPNAVMAYKKPRESQFRDTVVSILIDNSGSMRGRPIAIAATVSDILARVLERCGVKVEILGFTTRGWKGGKSRELWLRNGRPENPGRLNDVRHIIYKAADTPWRRVRMNVGLMLKEGLLKENIDGEALVWAHNRLTARPEQRKILIVISDGAPVDDSTLSTNPSSYLENDLRSVIRQIEGMDVVELTAIGIGHDVSRYYENAITIADADALGKALINEVESLFSS